MKQEKIVDSDSEEGPHELIPSEEDNNLDVIEEVHPENGIVFCIFCDGSFLHDREGELWIQCLISHMWGHEQCSGSEKDPYKA